MGYTGDGHPTSGTESCVQGRTTCDDSGSALALDELLKLQESGQFPDDPENGRSTNSQFSHPGVLAIVSIQTIV